MSSEIRCDLPPNGFNCWWFAQIVDTPLEESDIVPGMTQHPSVTRVAQQTPNQTGFVAVIHRQPFACPGGTLTDNTLPKLIPVHGPILVSGDAVGGFPALLLRY
jgi:hypothetical protein